MHPLLITQLLILLAVANGTPIIVEKLLGKLLAFPIDGGATFADGKPLLGRRRRCGASHSLSWPPPPSHR